MHVIAAFARGGAHGPRTRIGVGRPARVGTRPYPSVQGVNLVHEVPPVGFEPTLKRF